jgi:hypothetical protein
MQWKQKRLCIRSECSNSEFPSIRVSIPRIEASASLSTRAARSGAFAAASFLWVDPRAASAPSRSMHACNHHRIAGKPPACARKSNEQPPSAAVSPLPHQSQPQQQGRRNRTATVADSRAKRCTLCTAPCARAPAVSVRFVSVSWAAHASLPRRQIRSLTSTGSLARRKRENTKQIE